MKTKVVVTGGAGFIGSHMVKMLLKAGYEVAVLDNFSTGDQLNLMHKKTTGDLEVPKGLTIYECDITSGHFPIIEFDHLIHLAAPVSVEESLNHPEKYWQGIVTGSKLVFQWAKSNKVKSIVAASTAAIYGDSEVFPFLEEQIPMPMSPYAESKLEMEHVLSWFDDKETNCTAIRFFNVFGEGQRDSGGYVSAVPIFLKQYESFQPITVTGDGLQTRDFVYVGDICQACLLAMHLETEEMEVFNAGSGQETSVLDLAEAFSGEIKHIAARNEPKRSVSDITRITAKLEWKPEVNVLAWIKQVK
jgi:nucleoside-diphosphate-sugar epimerase